jgi:hypothetical protein
MGDAVLANMVYERTRSALTVLLPRRAATSVLDRALARHHRSADDVDGEQMVRVLMSGVYRELRGLLPDAGLRRTLRRVALNIQDAPRAGRGATPSEVRSGRRRAAGGRAAAGAQAAAGDADEGPAAVGGASEHAITATAIDRDMRRLDAVAAALAELDGVQGVGLFDAGGRPLGVRGALPDAVFVGRMVVAGASLLEAVDPLRSIAIDTPHGRLVAVPVRPHWLALTGTTDLNLGAVYAALAALEEER